MTESKFWIIRKQYDDEEHQQGKEGFFQMKLGPIAMTDRDFTNRYELSCPLYRYDEYTCYSLILGLKEGSCFMLHDINSVASELFNQTLCGDVAFTFEDTEDEDKCMPLMRKQLIWSGMNPNNITLV